MYNLPIKLCTRNQGRSQDFIWGAESDGPMTDLGEIERTVALFRRFEHAKKNLGEEC